MLAPESIGQPAGAIVRHRLRDTEDDDEREHGGAGDQVEFRLGIVGRMLRSIPTIAPTNALTTTSRVNCAAFARNPSATLGNLLLAREQRHAEHAPLRRRLA